MDVNVRGTSNVLTAARDAGTQRFVFGSSSSVYGSRSEAPFRESDRTDSPLSPYAASKAAGELLSRTFHNLYGLEVVSLRFFTVYGPRQRPDLAIHKFARRMLAGQPLPFYGDGETRRDYTWVADIVAGVRAAIERPGLKDEVVNLGGARTTSLRELIGLLESSLGVKAILDRQPMQPGDVPLTSADVARGAALLGYAPTTPIHEGIARFAEWMRGEGRDWV
jgi:UDP-glucuronate 4-epimerase